MPSLASAKNADPGADVPRLARVVVQVGDGKRAALFYAELLGVQGRAVGGGRVYFDCGPVILSVLDPTAGGTKPQPTPEEMYFAVRQLAAFHERARQLGCLSDEVVHGSPAGEMVKRPWGERSFYAVDPWGNKLCFLEEKTLFTGTEGR
jgi:predicted enzyme related to lactoylglutathione lyase